MGNASYSDFYLEGILLKGVFTCEPWSVSVGRLASVDCGWFQSTWLRSSAEGRAGAALWQRLRRQMDQPTPGSWLHGIRKGRCWPLCSCRLSLFLFALDLVAAGRVARHLVVSSRPPSTPALSRVSCCHASAVSTLAPRPKGVQRWPTSSSHCTASTVCTISHCK